MTNPTPTLKTDRAGTRRWYVNDLLHRVDGPAVEYAMGDKEWWVNGKRHRVDGLAIEYADGRKAWYLNGELHRADGPAVEYPDGYNTWFFNGKQILAPCTHVLTVAFSRGTHIPEGAMSEMAKAALEEQPSGDQIGSLKAILHKYWPTDVKKILVTLLMDTDPAIKHLAFSLLGREELPDGDQGRVYL